VAVVANSSPTAEEPQRASGWSLVAISRADLFAGLCILGFANGIAGPVRMAVAQQGLGPTIYNTFGISVFAWIAFFACPMLLRRAPWEPVRRADLRVGGCALAAFMLPVTTFSWLALTGLALYLLRDRAAHHAASLLSFAHRAGWVLVATTVTMSWVPQLLGAAGTLMVADAMLVGWLSGAPRVGNTLRLADGSGYVWIEPGCSSLMNASIAFLCWVLFAQARGRRWSPGGVIWCLVACLAVIAINVARIAAMVRFPGYSSVIHDPGSAGAMVASWLSAGAVVGICALGTRRDRLVRVQGRARAAAGAECGHQAHPRLQHAALPGGERHKKRSRRLP
jgi:hypothetical protein